VRCNDNRADDGVDRCIDTRCMYNYIHKYIFTFVRIYVYICIYEYTYIYTYRCLCIHGIYRHLMHVNICTMHAYAQMHGLNI